MRPEGRIPCLQIKKTKQNKKNERMKKEREKAQNKFRFTGRQKERKIGKMNYIQPNKMNNLYGNLHVIVEFLKHKFSVMNL